jgi:galactose-1-phosphate uridylyltransferase
MGRITLSLNLHREIRKTCFLSPRRDFELEEQVLERRFDPLTGFSTFIVKGRFQYVKKLFRTDSQLLEKLTKASKLNCPFCPERVEQTTPKFPEGVVSGGRIRVGGCVAFPNLYAHSDCSVVVVLGPRHLVYPKELGVNTLTEGFQAGLEALKATYRANPELAYGTITMNYLPSGGATILHPHMQALASNIPFNYQRILLLRSYDYYVQTSKNYWVQLIEYEKRAQERFVYEDEHLVWITPFAPLRLFEVWGIFKEPLTPTELRLQHLTELANGLVKVLAYYEDRGILSVNFALILPRFGDRQKYFNPQVRVCARFGLMQPFLNDFNALAAILYESEAVEAPEDYALELKKYFH